jgi:hypothetical protein
MARWWLILAVGLVGCYEPPVAKPAANHAPVLTNVTATIQVAGGEITTAHVPVRSMGDIQETQTCFIWRDGITRSSAMQCPNDRKTFGIDPPE